MCFGHLPTPLEAAPRLSEALGIEVLIKRDDLTGLCVGGNKARLLEFAIGSLRGAGADTLIAYAAEQSNKLRDIAAVAARFAMKVILLIPGPARPDGEVLQGNRLLFDLLGADVRVVAPGADRAAAMRSFSTATWRMASTPRWPMSTRPRNCMTSLRRRRSRPARCSSPLARA